jgi:NTP pyrophosphatase (non-canonical NTP hydrolase)
MLITDNPEYKKVFEQAITTWGVENQRMMAVGEIGELLAEFGRIVQGRSSTDKMVDEIADTLIMVTQLALIYGEDAVKERIKFKLQKINEKLGNTNGK